MSTQSLRSMLCRHRENWNPLYCAEDSSQPAPEVPGQRFLQGPTGSEPPFLYSGWDDSEEFGAICSRVSLSSGITWSAAVCPNLLKHDYKFITRARGPWAAPWIAAQIVGGWWMEVYISNNPLPNHQMSFLIFLFQKYFWKMYSRLH